VREVSPVEGMVAGLVMLKGGLFMMMENERMQDKERLKVRLYLVTRRRAVARPNLPISLPRERTPPEIARRTSTR